MRSHRRSFRKASQHYEDVVSPEWETHRARAAALVLVPALIVGSALLALCGMT
jgi:hypothetical protein